MQVILKEDVEHLGNRGQVVKVTPGYGRNYLLPRGLAVEITAGNLKQLEHEKKAIESRLRKERGSAEGLRSRIESLSLSVSRKVGEGDALYGSVTNADIAEALAAHSIVIDKRKIGLAEPIRALGEYSVPVKLHRDVQAKVKLVVVKEDAPEA